MPTYLEYTGYELSHYTAAQWSNNGYGYGYGYGGGRVYNDNMRRMPINRGGGPDLLLSALVPSSFPPGTDPKYVELFNRIDRDRNGSISDVELQLALSSSSSFNQMRFSLRTVHLLIFLFTGSTANAVAPKEFVPLVRSLQSWKACFEKYDRNKNGRIDERELKEAMWSMGYNLSPMLLHHLVSKYDKSGAKSGMEFDYFIECCLLVKGLTERFKMKEDPYTGTATFTYDEFLLSVLPFAIMN